MGPMFIIGRSTSNLRLLRKSHSADVEVLS
jgi:hypothetical protein